MYEYTDSVISARLMIQMLQFVCMCRLVSLCTYRRTRRCLCRHCLWLRGEWEHKSEPVQRLNCRLTGRSVFSHVTGHSPNGGGLHVLLAQTEAVRGYASTFTICGLVTAATSWPSETEWNCLKKWMVRIKRGFFFCLLCSFDSVEMSAWKFNWKLNDTMTFYLSVGFLIF